MMTEAPSIVTVCGRKFSEHDLEVIRGIIASDDAPWRSEIARRTCQKLGWVAANGRLKEMSCRVALLRLQNRGLIQLPQPRHANGNGKPYQPTQQIIPPPDRIVGCVGSLKGLQLRPIASRSESKLWNEAIARFHYQGYTPLSGAQLRYLVEYEGGLLGAMGFGASAWKTEARDKWIGWTAEQRKAGLHLIVNNARFLLLPWVQVKNLASHTLSMSTRRIAQDWQRIYGYQPVLLETFVEQLRFSGACYRAANWVYAGETKGRGKMDRYNEWALSVKHVYLYPLIRNFRQELCRMGSEVKSA